MTISAESVGAQPPTLTEWADQRLRAAILQGQFGPGDPLVISSLAEQLGLSATPLREADVAAVRAGSGRLATPPSVAGCPACRVSDRKSVV